MGVICRIMATIKTIPNNAETRKLHKLKLWEAFLDVFHQFKTAAESYQHPALPINAHTLTNFLNTLEVADKWTKEAREKYTPSPFRDEFGGESIDLKTVEQYSICDALRHTSQFKELSKCIKEQAKLRAEVDAAFFGIQGYTEPTDWPKDPHQWRGCGIVLKSLKGAYIDSLLLIEEGGGEKAHKRFQERVQEIKVDHIAPFEHMCKAFGRMYSI